MKKNIGATRALSPTPLLKTLALAADFAPRCRRQLNRLRAMYDCGAMDEIGQAVLDKEDYAEHMWHAVDLLAEKLKTDEEKAVFSVNQIIALWDGDLPELDAEPEEGVKAQTEGDDDMLFLQDVTEEENAEQPQEGSNEAPGEEQEDGQPVLHGGQDPVPKPGLVCPCIEMAGIHDVLIGKLLTVQLIDLR